MHGTALRGGRMLMSGSHYHAVEQGVRNKSSYGFRIVYFCRKEAVSVLSNKAEALDQSRDQHQSSSGPAEPESDRLSDLIADGFSQIDGIADDAPFGIGTVIMAFKKLLDTAKQVQHNRSQCTVILADMGIMVEIMIKLEKCQDPDDTDHTERAMGQLNQVVEKAQLLFEGLSEKGQARQAVSAERRAEMIAEINNEIHSVKAATLRGGWMLMSGSHCHEVVQGRE
eukprot:gene5235-18465_t